MPSPTLRYAGHAALEKLEWIERHVMARPDSPEVRAKLVTMIEDLRHVIVVKMVGGFGERSRPRRRIDRKPQPEHILGEPPTYHIAVDVPEPSDTPQE
jgi:hypothetical protein